jgi:hypothetical protein
MRGCIWNGDGFKDTAKHLFVKETIREHTLDFFAISETGRDNFSAPFLNNLAGGFDYQWFYVPPIGRSGGILVGFNAETFHIQDVITGDRSVKFYVTLNGLWLLFMGQLKRS